MEKRNFDLLRPFDLEAAKAGESLMRLGVGEWVDVTFVAEGGEDGDHAVRKPDGNLIWGCAGNLRMAPLAWVEGKPVYKGDGPLYHHKQDRAGYYTFTAEDFEKGKLGLKSEPEGYLVASPENLTWTPPKVKREGWVNVYLAGDLPVCAVNIYRTKEEADALQGPGRIACSRIEWEE